MPPPHHRDGQCTIYNVQLEGSEIQVLDAVETWCTASPRTVQIDLAQYATGIYFIRLMNGGKVLAVKKVVKG